MTVATRHRATGEEDGMNHRHWQNVGILILGMWAAASPWILQQAMATEPPQVVGISTWNLWLVGIALVFFAAITLSSFHPALEWLNGAFGTWLAISPWFFKYADSAALRWNAVVTGVLVIVLAAWVLARSGSHRDPRSAAAH